ncbi:hypothetical protein EMIT0215P_100225 [Pseudomonas serboccidentalis]
MQTLEKTLARAHLNLRGMPRFSPVRVIRPVLTLAGFWLCRKVTVDVGAYSGALQQFLGASLYWRLPEVIREPADVRSHAKHSPGIAAPQR